MGQLQYTRDKMNYLVVVAHPDDEVLGAGATIHKLVKEGHNVALAIMVSQAAVYRFYCFWCLSVSGVITSSSKNNICQNAFTCLP